jgi:hypothetical protein
MSDSEKGIALALEKIYTECMNLSEDVINRLTIPTNPEEKFVYRSEWLVGAAFYTNIQLHGRERP